MTIMLHSTRRDSRGRPLSFVAMRFRALFEGGETIRRQRPVAELAVRLHSGAVVVAARGDHQAELIRPAHECLRLVRRMFGVPGFHPIEAFRGESVQLLPRDPVRSRMRSEEHTSELQSQSNIVCRLLLEKKTRTASSFTWTTTTLIHRVSRCSE